MELVPSFDSILSRKITTTFTNEEANMYALSFKGFMENDPDKDFVIDFDLAWKWAGFSRKDNAVRLLRSKFQPHINYSEWILRTEEASNSQAAGTRIMLTINTFKDFCLRADTKQADNIRGYYIKLEKLFHSCHKEYMESQLTASQAQISQLQSQVQQLTISTPTYEVVEKTKFVYVLSCDISGVYKVGRTKGPVKKRVNQLQTAAVLDIEVLLEQSTHDDVILESCCHYVLDKYRSLSNREHFRCNKDYIIKVVKTLAHVLDTLKGTYQTIDPAQVMELINALPESTEENANTEEPQVQDENIIDSETEPNNNNDSSPFFKFLTECCIYNQGSTTDLNKLKTEFASWLGTKVKALDKGTLFQVNPAFTISKTNICKSCHQPHKKGCCSNYNRSNKTTRMMVNNIMLAAPEFE